jgi:alkanesulfonate monooxygenase SsuD/methylene tetrahydromethanopterin reductase-like flavin-dependent oxidoreductase (luciferase family)
MYIQCAYILGDVIGRIRLDGPNTEPEIGVTMVIGLDEDESTALDIVRRGMEGLQRRTFAAHRFDNLVVGPEEQEAALAHLRSIHANMDLAIQFGAGTPAQIAERMASLLEPGIVDHIVLMTPAGDITLDEARRTLELFATEVKPQLEG